MLARLHLAHLPLWRSARPVTGLDIQAGQIVAATVSRSPQGLVVERAAAVALEAPLVRDGEVADPSGLAHVLSDFFSSNRLPRQVRAGLSSQRAVVRTVELPPLHDADDLARAVAHQAQREIAMSPVEAVIEHRRLGVVELPEGPRTRVLVAAARRQPVVRLLDALRMAGLRPRGIDLGAYALIRALAVPADDDEAVLYVHAGALTTFALGRGARCELTRVASVGLESMWVRLAEREGIGADESRGRLLACAGLDADEAALETLDQGVRELGDEIRSTLDFHSASAGAPAPTRIVLTGPLAGLPGIGSAVGAQLDTPVGTAAPLAARPDVFDAVSPFDVTIAAGLAVEEVDG